MKQEEQNREVGTDRIDNLGLGRLILVILTCDNLQIDLIWNSSISLGKILYYVIRYLSLLDATLSLVCTLFHSFKYISMSRFGRLIISGL